MVLNWKMYFISNVCCHHSYMTIKNQRNHFHYLNQKKEKKEKKAIVNFNKFIQIITKLQ